MLARTGGQGPAQPIGVRAVAGRVDSGGNSGTRCAFAGLPSGSSDGIEGSQKGTDTQLKSLKPQDKAYKIADALGLYVTVAASGTRSFQYDYRLDDKREAFNNVGAPSKRSSRRANR